jgi:hypothetical protein
MSNLVNDVRLSGRLTVNPKLYNLSEGEKPYATFNLAFNKKNTSTEYIPIIFWDHLANFVAKELKKGDKVLIEGDLQYPLKNGKPHLSILGRTYLPIQESNDLDIGEIKDNSIIKGTNKLNIGNITDEEIIKEAILSLKEKG